MRKLISLYTFIYLISFVWVIPALIYFTWGYFFFPALNPQQTIVLLMKLCLWIVLGGMAAYFLVKFRMNRVLTVARSVTPSQFVSRFEILGPHANEYLAISPSTDQLVVVDLNRKVARCEPLSFVKAYNVEDGERMAILTIKLEDFDCSTITFHFGRMHRHDVTSRLELALRW